MIHYPKIRSRFSIVAFVVALSLLAVACSGSSGGDAEFFVGGITQEQSGGDLAPGGFGAAGTRLGFGITEEAVRSSGGIAATAVPNAVIQDSGPAPTTLPFSDGDLFERLSGKAGREPLPRSLLDEAVAQVSSERVIIRNVEIEIEVENTTAAVEEIGNLAVQEGGWIVSTQSLQVHRASIDVRVPANRLDTVLDRLRGLSSKIVSEVSTSQDFTEEFTDSTARAQTLRDTVEALRELFSRAEDIEGALSIQQEITRVQSDIEALQARINFLSQSAAFSLVRVGILATPAEMAVDAGGDRLAAVGRPMRFRAEFTPPEGIDEFEVEWDFGDGSPKQIESRVAPLDTEGRLISAPQIHVYTDDTDSPYLVSVRVRGTGSSGAAEGEDVFTTTVSRVPAIEVFAGQSRIVEAGESFKFRGSFTRPDGVDNLSYTWNFGDGSAPVTIDAAAGETVAEVEHAYANSRPQAYEVTLTVKGETAAGTTEGTGAMQVLVEEPESLTAGNFTPGDSGRSAFRSLSAVGSVIGNTIIWVGVLSPIWLTAGIVVFVLYRRRRHA